MRLRARRTTVYLLTAVMALALCGGFALGQLQLGPSSSMQQGSHTTTIRGVVGLRWISTGLVQLGLATVPTSTCGGTAASACSETGPGSDSCAGGILASGNCSQNHWVEQVTLATENDTPFTGNASGLPGTLELVVYVTNATTTVNGTPLYVSQASDSNSATTFELDFDVSAATGPGSVTSVSVVATG